MTKASEKAEAIAQLREWLQPGDTVYTILRHVSRSGMQREISVVLFREGKPFHPNWSVARALEARQGKDGIIVNGCGMDMGFDLVYRLGRALYSNGFTCTGEKCRSNDHSNGDRDYSPHRHSDGGYAFRQEWL